MTADGVSDRVLIYRDHLLPWSETFIRAQAEHLVGFKSVYAGLSAAADGLSLPDDRRSLLAGAGPWAWAQRVAFKRLGIGFGWPARLRRFDPRLIHAHFGTDAVHALALRRALGLPLIATFHGFEVTAREDAARDHGHRFVRYLRRRATLQREGALFIGVSDFILDRLLATGYPPDRSLRHYTGVDTGFFAFAPRPAPPPVVLFVGRLVAQKGGADLIAAMHLVQARIPDAELVVAGDGYERSAWTRSAAGLRARFLGVQDASQVRDLLRSARVLCVPSVTAGDGRQEAFGMVFAEAQSVGTPVVSTRSGGIPEAVSDGQTGLLVDEGDVHGLADALIRVLSEDGRWAAFSAAGAARVRDRFDLRRQSAQLSALYREVLAREGR